MTKDTGGPAFPKKKFAPLPGGGGHWTVTGGMTLRDWFAGQALVGMLASAPVADRSKPKHRGWAENAYLFADAMLAERSKP